jgi:voltage-gated potassium channel
MRPRNVLSRGRFMKLLVLLLALIVVTPLVEKFLQVRWFEDLLFSAILGWSVYSLEFDRRLLAPAGLMAVPGIAFMWLGEHRSPALAVCGHVCVAAFLIFVICAILGYIFRRQEVDPDTIAGSIVVYLLMALTWAFLYRIVEIFEPGSFGFNNRVTELTPSEFRYFSLMTITTVGYGDVTPVGSIARGFAALEAVVGQLFLVILVSWLVGMYVSRRSGNNP